MRSKLEEIKQVFGIDLSKKSKAFKHRYLRMCFYIEFRQCGHEALREILKVQNTDIRRYQKQIDLLDKDQLFIRTKEAYLKMNPEILNLAFLNNLRDAAHKESGANIPYSIYEVIFILKDSGDFTNPLWDKDLKDYTKEDWEEIEMLK